MQPGGAHAIRLLSYKDNSMAPKVKQPGGWHLTVVLVSSGRRRSA